jgi:hypothetical protein
VNIHLHRMMLLPEVVRQFGVRHQVEPHELHDGDPGLVCATG